MVRIKDANSSNAQSSRSHATFFSGPMKRHRKEDLVQVPPRPRRLTFRIRGKVMAMLDKQQRVVRSFY